MSYSDFVHKVIARAVQAGISQSKIRFSCRDGKYLANIPGVLKIAGNSIAKRVEFVWGSGHRAYGYL